MAFDAGSVIAKIKADITEFKKGLNEAKDIGKSFTTSMNQGIEKITPTLQKTSLAFAAVGAAGTLLLKDWVSAAGGAQAEMAKFENVLANVWGDQWGTEAETARKAMLGAADAAVKLGFDDEAAALSMAGFYQRTKDSTKAIELNNLAMDLARMKNIDLSQAGTLVNQVLSGNGKVLKQYGIDIKETASPLEALAQLQSVVGGQAATFADTMQGKLLIMETRISNFKERLGTALIPIMERLMEIGEKVLAWLEGMDDSTVSLIAKIVLFGTAAALIIAPLLILVTMIPALVAGFGMLFAAIGLLFSPIGLVVALFVALGVLIYKYRDEFAAFFQILRDNIGAFMGWLIGLWDSDFLYIQSIVTTWVQALTDTFTLFWSTLQMLFTVALNLLTGNWKGAWSAIKQWATDALTIVGDWAGKFWENLKALFSLGTDLIAKAWAGAMDGLKSVAMGVWEGVKSAFTAGINWIIDKMNNFIRSLGAVTGAIGKAIGVKSFNIPTIPRLAQGGIVTSPTLAMIGESGAEAVVPLDKANGALGGVHFHFHDSIISSKEAAREMLDEAVRSLSPNLGV